MTETLVTAADGDTIREQSVHCEPTAMQKKTGTFEIPTADLLMTWLEERKYVYNNDYDAADAHARFMTKPPDGNDKDDVCSYARADYIGKLCKYPILTSDQEYYWFHRMNFQIHRLRTALNQLQTNSAGILVSQSAMEIYRDVKDIEEFLCAHNYRLAVKFAGRYKMSFPTKCGEELESMVCLGCETILNCVRKFDVSLGYKFSTFATRSLINTFKRFLDNAGTKKRQLVPFSDLPYMDIECGRQARPDIQKISEANRTRIICSLLNRLSPEERQIIIWRFGLNGDARLLLREIGKRLGVTKERARQRVNEILDKIREKLEEMSPDADYDELINNQSGQMIDSKVMFLKQEE